MDNSCLFKIVIYICKVINNEKLNNMKGFRYNAQERADRAFNNCGREKNPNALKFYASNMAYADNYKYVYMADGDVAYECSLEVVDINTDNLFDMSANYTQLATYNNYINALIEVQRNDYTNFLNNAKKASDKKLWASMLSGLDNKKNELTSTLVATEFQALSDFEIQDELVAELKGLGFEGYTTKNEIVIF